ncbi:hypothetical protein EG329_002665 [Mollisiaceae sp. DMI_Dod_QoI]|nr:hypothetical protein EG329_002665 [Helotiales sp. DMI_Dod_QoI]
MALYDLSSDPIQYDIHYRSSNFSASREHLEYCANAKCSHCQILAMGIALYRPNVEWKKLCTDYDDDAAVHVTSIVYADGGAKLDFFVQPAASRFPEQKLVEWNIPLTFPRQWRSQPFFLRDVNIGDTGSEASLTQAKSWLDQCSKQHKECAGLPKESRLPTRVLDLHPLDAVSADIKLVETLENQCGSYICLSHCWGQATPIKTRRENISSMKDQILWDALPRTFQEAVTVCRRLRLRWLWIDSLCIIQDDEMDWKTEAAKMKDIYSNSFLTIAATKSTGSGGGLFTSEPPPPPLPICQVSHGGGLYNVFVQEFLNIPHESSWSWERHGSYRWQEIKYRTNPSFPLVTRGWAFQERLLSPRVLHFGIAELFYECRESYWCECKRISLPKKASLTLKGMDISAEAAWRDVCQLYSETHLTFPAKDTLPALAGLARRFSQVKEGRYIAGVWETELGNSLAWCERRWHGDETKELARVSRDTRLPSWSWASSGLPISFPARLTEFWPKVHGVDYALAGPDPFGEIEMARLDIEGDVIPAVIRKLRISQIRIMDVTITDSASASGIPSLDPLQPGPTLPDRNNDTDISIDAWWQESYDDERELDVLIFPIGVPRSGRGEPHCLILIKRGDDDITYKRIGRIIIYSVKEYKKYIRRIRLALI